MQSCKEQPIIYSSTFKTQKDPTTITIITVSSILFLNLVLLLMICTYNRYSKKFVIQPSSSHHQLNTGQAQGHDVNTAKSRRGRDNNQYGNSSNRFQIYNRFNSNQKYNNKSLQNKSNHPQQIQNEVQVIQQQSRESHQVPKGCINATIQTLEIFVSKYATMSKLKICSVIGVLIAIASIIMLIFSVISSEQALNNKFPNAQCILNQTTSNFVNGNDNWVGLSYMVPNLTKLQLNLNTRVKATRNSLTSLLLNGTNTTFPIGFPNGTSIPNALTGTAVVSRSVQTFVQARLRQWLIMNSTLSGTYRFPICQNTTISNIPHPLNDNTTIELNYMGSICNNLTQQVNLLVANARAADQLLTLTTTVQNTKQALNSNLNSHNTALSRIALRSNQYTTTFSSTNQSLNSQRAIPYVMLSLSVVSFIILIAYYIFQYRRFNKYIDHKQEYIELYNQNDPQNPLKFKSMKVKVTNKRLMIEAQNISVSQQSQLSPEQLQTKKQNKIKEILRSGLFANSKFTYFVNGWYIVTISIIGLSSISYLPYINRGIHSCQTFRQINQGKNLSQISELTSTQVQLLIPIQTCQLNQAGRFLQTADTQVQIRSMQQLYKISQLYNNTTPINLLNSTSLQQIEVLKGYLLHMETMPVKSQNFQILTLMQQLNTYTNGSSLLSKQKNQCGSTILRDQYVYNVQDCKYALINYLNQTLVTQPRCLQIPTYEGSGGSKQADLNDAQHTIQLNTSCPSVIQFYNSSNTNCFLGKRLALLRGANCSLTAAEYGRRLKNLLRFSIQTGSYTNSYMQNLRNYFGVYSVLSSNMTQFFNGINTSSIVNQFGVLSHNLINKTSCSYVKSSVQDIFNKFCPNQNSIMMVLYDSYAWMLLSFGFVSLSWISLIIWQIIAKTYMKSYLKSINQDQNNKLVFNLPNRFFKNNKIANINQKVQKKQKKVQDYKKSKLKKIDITEQTLRNQQAEQVENGFQYVNRLNIAQNQQFKSRNKGRMKKERMLQEIDLQEGNQIQNIQIKVINQNNILTNEVKNDKQSSQKQSNGDTQKYEAKYDSLKIQKTEKKDKQRSILQVRQNNIQNVQDNINLSRREDQIQQKAQNQNEIMQKSQALKGGQQQFYQVQQKKQQNKIRKAEVQKYQIIDEKNIFQFNESRQEQQVNQLQTVERATKYKQSSLGYNRGANPLQFQLTEQNEAKQQVIKKSPRFFESLDDEDLSKIKGRQANRNGRKIQSNNHNRQHVQPQRQQLQKNKINTKSIAKISKQGREIQMLRAVQMNQILNQTIDLVDLRNKQDKKLQ